jgi:hypothetical protein
VLQVIDGHAVGPEEIAAAKEAKRLCLDDAGFRQRYLAGGFNERRTMTLLSTILSGGAA